MTQIPFDPQIVADRLRQIRKENGLTLREFTNRIGLPSMGPVQSWMVGKTCPSAFSMFHIAMEFNVSADWLLGMTDLRRSVGGFDNAKKNV